VVRNPLVGHARIQHRLPLILFFLCLAVFAIVARPHVVAGQVPGDAPDALDYAYGAQALLHGSYVVHWIGPASMGSADFNGIAHIPRYPPGYAILLLPAVALGGVSAAVWTNFACGLLLGILAAWLAVRLGDARAAPVAVGGSLFTVGGVIFSQTVMSDLPTATLVLLELVLLILARTPRATLLAGLLAGALVWIRIPNLLLVLAGLASLTARPNWRRLAAAYSAGALLGPLLLGLWQYRTFGSPFTTGYANMLVDAHIKEGVGSFFRLQYILGQPVGRSGLSWNLDWSNALLYPLTLLGFKLWITWPGLAVLGCIAALRFIPCAGERGMAGRFTMVALLVTLATYLPYFWQAVRFLLVPAVLLNTLAAAMLISWLFRFLERRNLRLDIQIDA
jgi:4-amino-4-deoxy-L-arabinose transferase-like glycosyltransferase